MFCVQHSFCDMYSRVLSMYIHVLLTNVLPYNAGVYLPGLLWATSVATVCKPDVPGWDVEHISHLTTLVAAFLSAVVGGEESGHDVIWPTVNLDGENVGRMCLQPRVYMCLLSS